MWIFVYITFFLAIDTATLLCKWYRQHFVRTCNNMAAAWPRATPHHTIERYRGRPPIAHHIKYYNMQNASFTLMPFILMKMGCPVKKMGSYSTWQLYWSDCLRYLAHSPPPDTLSYDWWILWWYKFFSIEILASLA